VLPLTLVLVAAAVVGITTHERSMREMLEELDARSARLAAVHLRDELEGRVALLMVVAAGKTLLADPEYLPKNVLEVLFDGGLAYFDAFGELVEAVPSTEVWQARSVFELLSTEFPQKPSESLVERLPLFSSLYAIPSPFFGEKQSS
jgi:hypothetical protein